MPRKNSSRKTLVLVFWVFKDDDVTAGRVFEAVGDLIYDEVLTIMERRFHRSAGNNEWLCDKNADRDNNRKRDQCKTQNLTDSALLSLLRSLNGRNYRVRFVLHEKISITL